MRDELANLVWAVETIIPSVSQKGIRLSPSQTQADKPTENGELSYRLGENIPENWIPFLPVKMNNTTQLRLQRAKIPGGLAPKGQILQDTALKGKPYFIREEEIGRSGTIVERNWQRARWLNGKTFTWIGHRKINGRIEETNILSWGQVTSKNITAP